MKTILLVFGTRPEAIKMCPLARALKTRPDARTLVCVTGQHQTLTKPVLAAFGVTPDWELGVMRQGQSLFELTAAVMEGVRGVLEQARPDVVLVHGDTTTAFAAALAAFYMNIPVGHVEAGLRTYNAASPYPEEFDRHAADVIARYCFAPTKVAQRNLLNEGKRPQDVFVTGNTVIDALRFTVRESFSTPLLSWAEGSRLVLVTAHRRESLGAAMGGMLRAVRRAVDETPDVKVVCPLHPNPAARQAALEALGGSERIRLVEPPDVVTFHNLLARCCLVLTDSGGIQEEATALGKPVLVLRDVTERPEGVDAGTLLLAGTEEAGIYRRFRALLDDAAACAAMSRPAAVYGDGKASERIADILLGAGPR